MLLARGWDGEAQQHIEAAIDAAAGACAPLDAGLAHARQRDRIDRIDRFVELVMDCDQRSTARLAQLVAARRWERADSELNRLLSLEPGQAAARYLPSRLDVAEGREGNDDSGRILELYEALSASRPRSAVAALGRVDALLGRGRRDEALQTLDRAIDAEPMSLAELRRIRSALGGRDDLAAFRVNGAEVIERFEASGAEYEEPQLLLFDYTAVRVFDDQSSLVLTHQIYKAQSEESVDDLGQFVLPEGAYVLSLRTIKADGTRLEPDLIEGTGSINLPTVSAGDYVESEYVRVLDPPVGIPGGILGERFYFASDETPFHRSELVVATPESMELSLDLRGDAPAMQRSTLEQSGETLRVHRWRVDRAEALVPEAMSINGREYIPSVGWAIHASWSSFFEGLRDVLADRDPIDPAAIALAREIVRGASSPRSKAERLYEWVSSQLSELTAALSKTRGVTSTFLVSRYGEVLEHSKEPEIAVERIGETVVEGLDFLTAFAESPQYWVLECNGGIFVMQTVDSDHVLVAIGQAGANFGALRYTMDKTKSKFADILTAAPE